MLVEVLKKAYPTLQMFNGGNSKFRFGYFLSSALTLLVIEVTLFIVGCWVVYKWERRPEITDQGYTIISSQLQGDTEGNEVFPGRAWKWRIRGSLQGGAW